MEKIPKHEVATELLNQAIRLYLENGSYFAALHLAGAAEEVLEVYLKGTSEKSAYQRTADLIIQLVKIDQTYIKDKSEDALYKRLKNPKHSVKHKFGHDDNHVEFDAKLEAKDLIDRAISNYYLLVPRLGLSETPLIIKYRNKFG